MSVTQTNKKNNQRRRIRKIISLFVSLESATSHNLKIKKSLKKKTTPKKKKKRDWMAIEKEGHLSVILFFFFLQIPI